jgi:hypothetical protein
MKVSIARFLGAVAMSICALSATAASAAPLVAITEFLSNTGGAGDFEFIEFTNISGAPVNMAGWSESDSDDDPGTHLLSGFGILAPGESAILTEGSPNAFRTLWWGSVAAAPAGLKILGPYSNENLSSSGDTIHLYDSTNTLVDQLVYPNGGGTGNGVTRNPLSLSVLGTDQNSQWVNSALGDAFGSFRAANFQSMIGNPGVYAPAAVPEPSSIVLGGLGFCGLAVAARRRLKKQVA